jgi:hypothetical protein
MYDLCRSCRGLGDLQLFYSPVGPLLLKNLEQNAIEQGQVEFFKIAASRVRAHAWRRARGHTSPPRRPTGHNRRCTAATAGPTAPPKPSSPRVPHSQAEQTNLAAAQPMAAPPYFACAPAHIAVHAPRRPWAAIGRRASHRPCAMPWPTPQGTSAYKRSQAHRRARCHGHRATKPPLLPPWCPRWIPGSDRFHYQYVLPLLSLGSPVAPLSLVGQTELLVHRSRASSGGRRRLPRCPPAGPLPVVSKYPNWPLVKPRPSPAISPAKTTGELARIRPDAPSPWPKGRIARFELLLGCFVQTEGLVVILQIFPGVF